MVLPILMSNNVLMCMVLPILMSNNVLMCNLKTA